MKLATEYRGEVVEVGKLPDGDDGITATIAAMQAVVDHATFDPDTRARLMRVVKTRNIPRPADLIGLRVFAAELWKWCRKNVVFERDPRGVELVRHPRELLDQIERFGVAAVDCDDLAVFGCAAIAVRGLRPVLVTVGRRKPGKFEHVFFGIRTGDPLGRSTVYPLDPQEKTPAGEWPDGAERVKLWSLTVTEPGA